MSAVSATSGRPGVRSLVASRDEAVDGAFLIAAVALGLVGFKTTYGDYRYMVVGGFGLLAGVLIAYLAWKLRAPTVAALATAAIAFFAFGGAAVYHATALGGVVPTGGTLRSLASGSIHGWVDLLTLLPPIGSTGPLLVIPYLLGLSAGVTGYLLARRSRSALLPAFAPAAVLAASILLGTREPVSTLLQGGVFAVVVLAWGAVRQARRAPATLGSTRHTRRFATAGIVLLAAGAAAVAIGPRLPFAHSHSRLVMRSYVQPPFDPSAFPSPLAGFRNYVNQDALKNKPLFTVQGLPAGGRIRLATMDVYNGLVWGVSNGAPGTAGAFLRVGSRIPASAPGRQATVTVTVDGYDGVWLPDVGSTNSVHFTGSEASKLSGGFRYDLATGTGIVPDGLQKGDSYTLRATIPTPASSRTLSASAAEGQPAAITNAPSVTGAKANQWAGHGNQPYAALQALATHLRAGGYSDGGKDNAQSQPGHGTYRLQQFLTGQQLVGDDEQYAAAFALLANQLGYPTRVVLGAVPEPDGVVKGRDVHAWAEVDLTGAGWVPFNVTPPKSHHPNPIPPIVLTTNHVPSRVPPPIQASQPAPQTASDSTVSSSSKRPPKTHHHTFAHSLHVVATVGTYAGPPILAIALLLGSILALKGLRRSRRRRRGSPAQKVSAGWRELVDLAVDLGAPRPVAGTRRMSVRALGRADLTPMAGAADAASFGPSDPEEADARQYWTRVDETRKLLLAQTSRRTRIGARLSLASLHGPTFPRRTPAPAVEVSDATVLRAASSA